MSTETFIELSLMPGALGELHASITDAIQRVDGRIELTISPHMAKRWAEIRAGLVDAREQIEAQYTEGHLPMSHDCADEVCRQMPLDDLESADWTDRWPFAEWCAKSQRWLLEAVLDGDKGMIEEIDAQPVRIYGDDTVEAVEEDEYCDGYIAKSYDIEKHNAALAANGGAA